MPAIFKKIITITIIALSSTSIFAQGGGNSPYTILGLGEPQPKGNIRNIGMGGAGVAAGSGLYSNVLNPALLVYNKLTVFDAGYFGEYTQLESQEAQQQNFGANFRYLNMTFPANRRWTMAVGLRPLTSVSYEINSIEKIPQTPAFVQYTFSGDGGISQVYFSHGVNIYKGLSLGLEFNFNFGTINTESTSTVEDGSQQLVGLFERTAYRKLNFRPGISYTQKLGDETSLSFGATYEPKSDYNTTFFQSTQRKTIDDIRISTDTLALSEDRTVTYPSSYIIGLSLEKRGRYTIALDYESQNWTEFSGLSTNSSLTDSYRVSLGAEWTPDYTSVTNYFKRVTLRGGFRYEKLPYVVNGTELDDIGVNFGASFPISRGFSSVSFSAEYGVIDVDTEQLIREQYFKFNLGLTINDRWFVRRRVN